MNKTSDITDSINQNFARTRTDLYNSLPKKKYWLFIMFQYSLSQLFITIKVTTTIIYF